MRKRSKEDTASIRSERLDIAIAKPLRTSIFAMCKDLGIEFKTMNTNHPELEEGTNIRLVHHISDIRELIFEIFKAIDITHYYHLMNVGILADVICTSQIFKRFLRSQETEKFHDSPTKKREINEILEEDFLAGFKLDLELHDIGKVDSEVQEYIHTDEKLTDYQKGVIMSHTATDVLFDELGISIKEHNSTRLTSKHHHTPEYSGADPSLPTELNIPDEMMKRKELAQFYIPIRITLAKIIDIIEAMCSQIRTYKDERPIRWYDTQTDDHFKRGDGVLHTSIEAELLKKCPEFPELAYEVLSIVTSKWEGTSNRPGLKDQLVTTLAQLEERGEKSKFEELIKKYCKKRRVSRIREYYSGRLKKVTLETGE